MSVIYDPRKPLTSRRQPARPPRSSRQRRRLNRPRPRMPYIPWRALAVVVVIALAAVAGWYCWQASQSQGSNQPSSALPADMELIAPAHTYLSLADASAGRPLKLSLVAPKSWRTTRLAADNSKLLNPKDYQIGRFSFTDGSSDLTPTGQLSIEDISNWLTADDPGANHQTKQNYVSYLENLRQTQTVSGPGSQKIIPIGGETGSRQLLQYVNSADSKLSGAAYAVLVRSGDTTAPHVVGDLAGVIDGWTIYAHLDIAVSDTPDPGQFASGNVGDATHSLTGQAVSLLKSLTLDTSARDAQAPAVQR